MSSIYSKIGSFVHLGILSKYAEAEGEGTCNTMTCAGTKVATMQRRWAREPQRVDMFQRRWAMTPQRVAIFQRRWAGNHSE